MLKFQEKPDLAKINLENLVRKSDERGRQIEKEIVGKQARLNELKKLNIGEKEELKKQIQVLENEREQIKKVPGEMVECLRKNQEVAQRYETVDAMRGMLGKHADFEQGLRQANMLEWGESALILAGLAYGAYKIFRGKDWKGKMFGGAVAFSAVIAAKNKAETGKTHQREYLSDLMSEACKQANERIAVLKKLGMDKVVGGMVNRIEHEQEGGLKSLERVIKEKDQNSPDRFTEVELRKMLSEDQVQKVLSLSEVQQREMYEAIRGSAKNPGIAELAGRKAFAGAVGEAMDRYQLFSRASADVVNTGVKGVNEVTDWVVGAEKTNYSTTGR